MNLLELEKQIQSAQAVFEGQAGQARLLLSQLRDTKLEVDALQSRIEDLSQISALLSSYADDQQAAVQGQIEAIVSKGLQTIFQEDLVLKIVNRMVGRRPETDFVLVSNSGDQVLETSILDARGGGVAAVAGFLIQAVLVLLTPGLRPVLFLDEVFAQVSQEYLPALSEFIKELVDKSPLQVVLVTHSQEFSEAADRVYRFSQGNGITKVVEGVNL
jgi:DNA repair exonuclease SbcCD ATPase subunit